MAVVLNDLAFSYSINAQPVFANVNLTVERGARVVLVGANGAGKTTLLNLIGGKRRPRAGSATVLGEDSFECTQLALKMNLVTSNWDEDLTLPVKHLVGHACAGHDRARCGELAEALGMAELMHRELAQLSEGQRRRVQLFCKLVPTRDIVLLDEVRRRVRRRAGGCASPRVCVCARRAGDQLSRLSVRRARGAGDQLSRRAIARRAARLPPSRVRGACARLRWPPPRLALTRSHALAGPLASRCGALRSSSARTSLTVSTAGPHRSPTSTVACSIATCRRARPWAARSVRHGCGIPRVGDAAPAVARPLLVCGGDGGLGPPRVRPRGPLQRGRRRSCPRGRLCTRWCADGSSTTPTRSPWWRHASRTSSALPQRRIAAAPSCSH
eukprot:7388612-Prymnesium_polylepis.2